MPLLAALAGLLLIGLIFAPQWWVHRTIRAHAGERPDLPGTGGELARHLLDLAGLKDVVVEALPKDGDHYDPVARAVRLGPLTHDGRSVSAVAIAVHEVGHALQHAEGDRLLHLRIRMAPIVRGIELAAMVVLGAAPLTMIFLRSPALIALQLGLGIAMLAARVAMHLVTLPVELDASFSRALPILERGRYLVAEDMPAARSVLRAAAFTYVASALVTLLNVARWFRI